MILLYEFSNTDIVDFCLLPSNSFYDSRDIIVLTEHKVKKFKRYLEIIHIPNYQVLHKIEINKKSWLIKNENHTSKAINKQIMDIDPSSSRENLLNGLYFIEENMDEEK